VPIADLNGKTLDEVFIGGNLVVNGDFSDGTTWWSFFNSTIVDEKARIFNAVGSDSFISRSSLLTVGNSYYVNLEQYITNDNARVDGFTTTIQLIDGFNSYIRTAGQTGFAISRRTPTVSTDVLIDNIYLINLTALGITATKEQLDFWYSVWQQNHKLGMRVHRASGNDIPLAVLNNQSLNQVFVGGQVNTFVTGSGTALGITFNRTGTPDLITANGTATNTLGVNIYDTLNTSSTYYFRHRYISGTHSRTFTAGANTIIETANMQQNNSGKFTNGDIIRLNHITGTIANNYNFSFYLYNLTSLGIATLTKSQLDYLYQVWQFNQVNALVARQFIQEA
jgi:hypothetical protein